MMSYQIVSVTSKNYSELVLEESATMPNLQTLQWHERKCTAKTKLHRIAAVTPNGAMVGFGKAVTGEWEPILKPGHIELEITVEEDWRGQGIGSAIYENLLYFSDQNGGIVLKAVAWENTDGTRWLEKREFVREKYIFESELILSKFKSDDFQAVISSSKDSGIRLTTFAEYPQTDEWYERFIDLYWSLGKDAPGFEEWPRISLDKMKHLIIQTPAWDASGAILAVADDQWVALNLVIRNSNDVFYNNLTGVLPKYRGRRLAQAVKLKGIHYARNNGASLLRTHNDSSNIPMLHINRKFGYEPKPALVYFNRFL